MKKSRRNKSRQQEARDELERLTDPARKDDRWKEYADLGKRSSFPMSRRNIEA